MDTRALKDFALNVSTFARQLAQLRGFRIRGSREFSGPEIHIAGARACADHGLSPTKRGKTSHGGPGCFHTPPFRSAWTTETFLQVRGCGNENPALW